MFQSASSHQYRDILDQLDDTSSNNNNSLAERNNNDLMTRYDNKDLSRQLSEFHRLESSQRHHVGLMFPNTSRDIVEENQIYKRQHTREERESSQMFLPSSSPCMYMESLRRGQRDLAERERYREREEERWKSGDNAWKTESQDGHRTGLEYFPPLQKPSLGSPSPRKMSPYLL